MPGLIRDMFQRFEARQARFFDRLSRDARGKLAEVENKCA
ncbi:unnamed protein product, partial [marine sediment metagenome]